MGQRIQVFVQRTSQKGSTKSIYLGLGLQLVLWFWEVLVAFGWLVGFRAIYSVSKLFEALGI